MLEEKETPGMTTMSIYVDTLKEKPGIETNSNGFKPYLIISRKILEEREKNGDIIILCNVEDYTKEQANMVTLATKNGITEIPVGRTGERDEGR